MAGKLKEFSFAVLGDNPASLPRDQIEDGTDYGSLGFRQVVDGFVQRLDDSRQNAPFTVGVFAPWGQGKTTLMRMMQRRLEERGIATAWFNPWKYHNREEVWKGLALALVSEIKSHDSLSKQVKRRRKQFITHVAKGLWQRIAGKWGAELIDRLEKEPWSPSLLHEFEANLDQLFPLVEESHSSADKPFMVLFVDDLDRCTPEPAATVLEAMKMVLNRAGLVTVMGMAEEELSRAVHALFSRELGEQQASLDPQWGRHYLRKIIQVPLHVPRVSDDQFEDYVHRCLVDARLHQALGQKQPLSQKQTLKDEQGEDEELWPVDRRWLGLVRQVCGHNLREVKRFLNHYIAEWDKARSNLSQADTTVELDPARVAMILMLGRVSPGYHDHYLKIDSGWRSLKGFLAWQDYVIATNTDLDSTPPQGPAPEDFRSHAELSVLGLLERCLTRREEEPALVRSFEGHASLLPYLGFGHESEWSKPSGRAVDEVTKAVPETATLPPSEDVFDRPEPLASEAEPSVATPDPMASPFAVPTVPGGAPPVGEEEQIADAEPDTEHGSEKEPATEEHQQSGKSSAKAKQADGPKHKGMLTKFDLNQPKTPALHERLSALDSAFGSGQTRKVRAELEMLEKEIDPQRDPAGRVLLLERLAMVAEAEEEWEQVEVCFGEIEQKLLQYQQEVGFPTWFGLTKAQYAMEEFEAVLERLEQYLHSGLPELELGEALFIRGLTKRDTGLFEAALADLEMAADRVTGRIELRINIARLECHAVVYDSAQVEELWNDSMKLAMNFSDEQAIERLEMLGEMLVMGLLEIGQNRTEDGYRRFLGYIIRHGLCAFGFELAMWIISNTPDEDGGSTWLLQDSFYLFLCTRHCSEHDLDRVRLVLEMLKDRTNGTLIGLLDAGDEFQSLPAFRRNSAARRDQLLEYLNNVWGDQIEMVDALQAVSGMAL